MYLDIIGAYTLFGCLAELLLLFVVRVLMLFHKWRGLRL